MTKTGFCEHCKSQSDNLKLCMECGSVSCPNCRSENYCYGCIDYDFEDCDDDDWDTEDDDG